jgi:hypothetical protein
MRRRCNWLVDAPYLLAVNRVGKVNDCRIWTDYDDALIDKSRIEQVPLIWECLVSGLAEVTIGKKSALQLLTQIYEKQTPERVGDLLFSTHRIWDWTDQLD